jgi:ribonucleoside-diphosphate reductase alpha chain
MKCVAEDKDWYLMCPDECPGLSEVHNQEFVDLYLSYVEQGKYRKVVSARSIYTKILKSRAECGVPYIGEKDAVNRKSNQKNLGTIKSSNLCTEIVEYSDPQETAVCNLASLCLPKYIEIDEEGRTTFNHKLLYRMTCKVTKNLDKVIDRTVYPTPEAERSNYRHRPIGIGVQGLWDAFVLMGYPFGSPEAIKLDQEIFETIYYASLTASMELAYKNGPYSTFKFGQGSPLSKGIFQFDMWNLREEDKIFSGRWNWEKLRRDVRKFGVRNSELIAPMPTASTSQILGNIYHNNTECIEPIKSNLYKRKTTAGEFLVFNKHLMKDILTLGLDINEVRQQIEADDGSVQNVLSLPEHKRELYKTVWEIDQKKLVDHCASRSIFVTQACSMNLYFRVVDPTVLTEVDFYCWSKGIKTQYYTHSRSATKAKQHIKNKPNEEIPVKQISNDSGDQDFGACRMEEGYLMCGS